jgi:drug/metabolite transporter (DMT)-like permease
VVSQFCLLSGFLALATHALLEPPTPLAPRDVALLLALGLGPMGLAFYAWDAALKKGDPRVIGTLSYLTPLLSSALLALLGGKSFGTSGVLALVLIVGGAALGSLDVLRRVRLSRP